MAGVWYDPAIKDAILADDTVLRSMLTPVKHSGRAERFECPFCGRKSVYSPRGGYMYCLFAGDEHYGPCEAHRKGVDVFNVYAHLNGCSNGEAVRELVRQYAGHVIPGASSVRLPARAPEVKAPEVDTAAWRVHSRDYCSRCTERLPGSPAEAYMLRRGFTPETLRRFRVGYDPAAKVETSDNNVK